jgi:hypothetical protein
MPVVLTVSVGPVVTPIVPVDVIGPPERPFAVATLVTPVAAAVVQYAAVPFDERTCPAEPNPPFAERPDEPRITLPENVVIPATASVDVTFAKPVIVVLPVANVVMPETAPANVPVVADILLATVTLLLILLNVNPADPFELVESLNCMCVFDPPTVAAAP